MRALLVISSLILGSAATATPNDQQCRPTAPPSDPSSEDGNPGAGFILGLNEDDDFIGGLFGEIVSQEAQSQQGPRDPTLRDVVGNDCPKNAEG